MDEIKVREQKYRRGHAHTFIFPNILCEKPLWKSLILKSGFAGPFRHKFLRLLLPFWSSALPTLPVTAPPRKDSSNADDAPEGRTRHQRPSRMDPRKMLLVIAIM